jgi:hypothetical protein
MRFRAKRASVWLAYGLGSESNDLPAFVVLTPRFRRRATAKLSSRACGRPASAARLASPCGTGDPVLYVQNPPGDAARSAMLDTLNQLNRAQLDRFGDPERNASPNTKWPSACKPASSTWRIFPAKRRAPSTSTAPLPASPAHSPTAPFWPAALSSAARAVQILHRGWDQHDNIPAALKNQCDDTDRHRRFVIDLKRRGLLDETLVIWGGEFGRTVYSKAN